MSEPTVLVIDDNRDILELVRLQLEADGFKVVTLEDCSLALDYLTANNADVIVTDLMIPDITGLEFIHQLRRVSNYDRIAIIAMSAYDKTYLAAAVMAGAVDALHKPEELHKLTGEIRQALATDRSRASFSSGRSE